MPDATIQLADLRGIWRPVYARRQALHATADAIVIAAWRADTHDIDLGPAITAWRQSIGETEDPATQHRREAATATVLALLSTRTWTHLRTALALAAKRAHRAGWAAGHAIATRSQDDDTDYGDSEYTIASPDLSDDAAAGTATSTLTAILNAMARRTGRAMADSDDNPEADAQAALNAAISITLAADITVSAAYGAGLLAAYLATGAQAVNWVTAGDGRVCSRCSDNETNGPYSLLTSPRLPAHGNCRCALAPA